MQTLGEHGEARVLLLDPRRHALQEAGTLRGVGIRRHGMPVAGAPALERPLHAKLVVEDRVRAEPLSLLRQREHSRVPCLAAQAAERELVDRDVLVLVVRLDVWRAIALADGEALAVLAPELRGADLLELSVRVDAHADAAPVRLCDAGLQRLRPAHLRIGVVVGVEVVVPAPRPSEEANRVESVALGDVAELRDVGVRPHQLLVLLLHDDEQPAREVARPVWRGGADRGPRDVIPRAVALRRGVPVAFQLLENRLRQLPSLADADEHRMPEPEIDGLVVLIPAHAGLLRVRGRVVDSGVPRVAARLKREPGHREETAGIEARLKYEVCAFAIPRFPLLPLRREIAQATPESFGDVERGRLRIRADLRQLRTDEPRQQCALLVIFDRAGVRDALRRGAFLDHDLDVERICTSLQSLIDVPLHALGRLFHARKLARALHGDDVRGLAVARVLLQQQLPEHRTLHDV